jgi:hypothetical protein
MILLSLEALWWVMKKMELTGYPPEKLTYFDRVHFCASLAAFSLFPQLRHQISDWTLS